LEQIVKNELYGHTDKRDKGKRMEVEEIPENLAMNNQIFFAQRQQCVIGKNNLTCKTEMIRPTVK
jgi:hypothetical protein